MQMRRVRVSCLQLEARGLAGAETTFQRVLEMLDQAAGERPDLVVTPECTYPSYFLGSASAYHGASLRPYHQVVAALADKARTHRYHLVAGLVEPGPAGELYNAAILFGPDGVHLGTCRKRFLWHFDNRWFCPGTDSRVFETSIGPLGILICADARLMEIPRTLAVAGAALAVDSTAWVTSGRDPRAVSSPQFDYLLPTRAWENGLWFAAASKVGLEDGAVAYCGRSCVISPEGRAVAAASSFREEVLTGEMELDDHPRFPIARRPGLYDAVTKSLSELPPRPSSAAVGRETAWMASLQVRPWATDRQLEQEASRWLDVMEAQGVDLAVLPDMAMAHSGRPGLEAERALPILQRLTADRRPWLCLTLAEESPADRFRTAYLIGGGRIQGRWRACHLVPPASELFSASDAPGPVVTMPWGKVAALPGADGLVPEMARIYMLTGADFLLWPMTPDFPSIGPAILRSRADENRVYVAAASPPEPEGPGLAGLITPSGQWAAQAFSDREQMVLAPAMAYLARQKEIVPGTHLLQGRQPEAYDYLAIDSPHRVHRDLSG